MAHMCQLMLQSLKGLKREICLTTYEKIFKRNLLRVPNARTPSRRINATLGRVLSSPPAASDGRGGLEIVDGKENVGGDMQFRGPQALKGSYGKQE